MIKDRNGLPREVVESPALETSGTTQCHGLFDKVVLGLKLELDSYLTDSVARKRLARRSAGGGGCSAHLRPHPRLSSPGSVPAAALAAPPGARALPEGSLEPRCAPPAACPAPRGPSPPRGAAPAFLLLLLPPRSCGALAAAVPGGQSENDATSRPG